jgi:RsiW-degrading membrane proteinase PrsW (M82 family)
MCQKLKSAFTLFLDYFKNRKFEIHFFWLLGFNKKYYAAYKIIATNKKRNRGIWLLNNVIFPVFVIISPFILTIISSHFNTIQYTKSFAAIITGGALTLLGINVLRTSSTIISEKLNYDNIPSEYSSKISEVEAEINTLKKRLTGWSWVLSAVGFLLYFIQTAQLINDTNNVIYWFILGIVIVLLLSLFFGRFISLMESNLFDREEFTKLLFSSLITQSNDFAELENQLKNQGLL